MISQCIDKIDYAPCQCGRPASLMRGNDRGQIKYYVEAPCCHMVTVRLHNPQSAVNEFQRIRAAVEEDAYQWESSADKIRPLPMLISMGARVNQ